MEFGDRESFAIQIELDSDHGGSWLYGRFCYWINGKQVGDYDLGTSLRDVLFNMKGIMGDSGNRDGGSLCALSPEEAFLVLDKSLYGDGGKPQAIQLPDTPARFDISPPVDVFDHWKMYLISCGDRDLLLYKHSSHTDVQVFSTSVGMFDRIVRAAYNHLDTLYEKQTGQRVS